MKRNKNFYLLFLICSAFLFLNGCFPHKNIDLTDDNSLRKLNELIKDRALHVKTKGENYFGNNVIVSRDSTLIEDISTRRKTIPYISMKEINFDSDLEKLNGNIVLKNNQVIKARDIQISVSDSVIRFDEVITKSVIFPTIELKTIYKINHPESGSLYGLLGGTVVGAVLGTFLGTPKAKTESSDGFSRFQIAFYSSCVGGISGAIIGMLTGEIIGDWWDINVNYEFNENSP